MKIKKREEVEVMGTFAGYTGGMDILEEERDDFTQKILKLLNYSGMMNFEVVNMFGMELGLIKEVELRIKRYLSLLANKKLRQKYLEF